MLETERLALRAPREDDLPALTALFQDPEVMRHVAWGRPFTDGEVERMLRRMTESFAADGFGQLLVESKADGRVIGRAGLLPLDPRTWTPAGPGVEREIELGWLLARNAWGQGYGTEAATALRDWAWRDGGFDRLVSIIQVGNDRSARVAEKLGGQLDRRIVTSFGKDADLYVYRRPG